MLCPQLKQNIETIKTLKLELDLELPKLEGLFKIFKNGNKAASKKDRIELINKIKSLESDINLNIKTIESLMPNKIISALSPEGKEIKFELKEQLKYWNDFYKDEGVDWINFPENIKITEEQQKEVERLITEFGFDKMIIIPENLAATEANYEKLHTLMSKGYNETLQTDNFKSDGGFAGLKNKSNKLRIILTRDIEELGDDELFKQTLDKAMDEFNTTNGILAKNKLEGLGVDAYLVCQRDHFKRTGKHLDEENWTWLPGSGAASDGVSYGGWVFGDTCLRFSTYDYNDSFSYVGCRLAGIFEIE
jgi:hypothetical protein